MKERRKEGECEALKKLECAKHAEFLVYETDLEKMVQKIKMFIPASRNNSYYN
jgi:hypothetical protein